MMKEMKTGVFTCIVENSEKLYNFNFYTDLTVAEKLQFVDSVVSLLVDDNHYNSVIRDLVFNFYVVDIFTDIDTTRFKDSLTFLNDVEQFLEDTNIVEIVRANTSSVLFDELNNAVDKSVAYLTGIHPNPLNDAIANLFTTLEKKIGEVDLISMMDVVQKFAGMTEGFTPESIINAYMDSDVHKKNLVAIAEAKNAK